MAMQRQPFLRVMCIAPFLAQQQHVSRCNAGAAYALPNIVQPNV